MIPDPIHTTHPLLTLWLPANLQLFRWMWCMTLAACKSWQPGYAHVVRYRRNPDLPAPWTSIYLAASIQKTVPLTGRRETSSALLEIQGNARRQGEAEPAGHFHMTFRCRRRLGQMYGVIYLEVNCFISPTRSYDWWAAMPP